MEEKFSWIPFYMELAKALLSYKSDRKPLVDWIYSDLSQVGEKSLVTYLHMEDGSNIKDIDPFSVFAIFNRSLKMVNKLAFLQKYKEKFSLTSEVPTDFSGIPTVNSQRAFFFHWNKDNGQEIRELWNLFEDVVLERDISSSFQKVINGIVPKYSLTMILYWIAPYRYIGLDGKNRSFLGTLGYPDEYPDLDYPQYLNLLHDLQQKMKDKSIPYRSFPEVSYSAWTLSQTKRIWMFKNMEGLFDNNKIMMGSSAKGMLDFSTFKSKEELGKAYREVAGNTDVSIPDMYWKLMKDAKIGEIVVVFDSRGKGKSLHHILRGWGRIISECMFNPEDDNPIQRNVEWHMPLPDKEIIENKTNNTRYFHYVEGIEAANIINLLGINSNGGEKMETTKNDKYIQLLRSNKNLILTGAPGTGKTYMAKAIAKEMSAECEFVQFHPSFDYTDFVEGLRPIQESSGEVGFERRDGVFKEFCKSAAKNFEDSRKSGQELTDEKSFEEKYNELIDKIESGEINEFQLKTGGKTMEVVKVSDFNNIVLKTPDTSSNRTYTVSFARIAKLAKVFPDAKSLNEVSNIYYAVRDAIKGCNTSAYWAVLNEVYKQGEINVKESLLEVKEKPYVFIIDEINRGEISKIFGELFFSIDPGYRGVAGRVKTQYQNLIEEGDAFKDGFYVPENVYIIGTMNDIDRSVESMDFAMRRRFAWAEVSAEDSMQMLKGIANESEVKIRMRNLNNAILKVRGLGKAYQIGAAYFKKIVDYAGDFQKLWDFHLEGLLFEYLRGNMNAEEQMQELKRAYDNNALSDETANSNQG
jgi:Cdc6-like AAA superfamily ATPase